MPPFDILGRHFGTSGAPQAAILAPRGHSGGPWEQQDGVEVVRDRIFIDFGVILEPVYISFLNSRSLKFHFFGLVSGSLFYRVLNWYFDAWDSEFEVFAKKALQKTIFHRYRFV